MPPVAYEGDGDFLQEGGTVKIRGIDREIVNQNIRGRLALSKANPVQSLNSSQQNYVGFTIGRGGLGIYGLENGELLVSHGEVIGLFQGSNGFFRHAGGRHFVGETLTIARDAGSVGQYDFYDGLLTVWWQHSQ